jgi:hypothetical protein
MMSAEQLQEEIARMKMLQEEVKIELDNQSLSVLKRRSISFVDRTASASADGHIIRQKQQRMEDIFITSRPSDRLVCIFELEV